MKRLPKKLRALKKLREFDLLILFGSYARGHERDESDLDLAFMSKKSVEQDAMCDRIARMTHIDQVDLVDLKHCEPLLGMKVIQEGTVLIEKKRGMFPEIASYIARKYADTQKFRDAQSRMIDNFLKERAS